MNWPGWRLGWRYFVVNLDLSRNVNNINQVNQLEVLFLIGVAVYKLAQEARLTPDRDRFDALIKSLESIVQMHTENKKFSIDTASLLRGLVCFGTGVAAGPLGAVAAAGVTEALRDFIFVSGTDVSIVRKVEVEPQIREMLGHVNAILNDVRAKSNGPLALLVDGLEFVQNEEVAELLFVRNRFLADVDCRILYTVPVFVYYQPRFAPVRQAFQTVPFPNVRLRHRDNPTKQDEAGYAAMHEVVSRRLESVGYKPEAVITRDAVNLLISASGGLMRDLIRLMRDACVQAEIAGRRIIEPQTASRAPWPPCAANTERSSRPSTSACWMKCEGRTSARKRPNATGCWRATSSSVTATKKSGTTCIRFSGKPWRSRRTLPLWLSHYNGWPSIWAMRRAAPCCWRPHPTPTSRAGRRVANPADRPRRPPLPLRAR